MSDETPSGQSSLPLRRRLAYWVILIVIAAALCELVSLAVYRLAAGEGFSFSVLEARRSKVVLDDSVVDPGSARAAASPDFVAAEVVHPYLGYVVDPTRQAAPGRVHPQGLPGVDAAFDAPRDTVVVGVFGGSVAAQLVEQASGALTATLSESPAFAGRPIAIASTALGGYKEPQQALALAYLQMLGARFDVVINLDGFNDVVLPAAESLRSGVFHAYPRAWSSRTAALEETPVVREVGAITVIRSLERDLARFMDGSFARHFVTPNVLWYLSDRRLSDRIWRHQRLLEGARAGRYLQSGPVEPSRPDLDQVFRRSAELWGRGSMAMDALARGHGASYFHFLQPNQYVEGSKPLNDEERRIAWSMREGSYGPTARRGYPFLIAEGRRLAEAGLHFEDLTPIFAGDSRTIYADDCCHVNQAGSDILARHIGETIVEELARSGPRRAAP